jgi:trehalose synthase
MGEQELQRTLDDYAATIKPSVLDGIRLLASRLSGTRVQHINSTKVGGGVAEILHKIVPLMQDLGIETRWDTIGGDDEFFKFTKKVHNALHGERIVFEKPEFDHFFDVNRSNENVIDPQADIVVIHDPQPLALIEARQRLNSRNWIWRCHIDLSRADTALLNRLAPLVEKYSASIFSMPEFSRPLDIPQYMISPSIDPISDKNKPLTKRKIAAVLERFGIDPDRPILTQVSRFDRLKDPLGVIDVYRLVKRRSNLQLVLAGGAADDDPEGQEVLAEVREKAGDDPDIHILNLPPFSDVEINALVRGSTVVIQKSIREGFGLTVTEALWKRRPVIASPVGGIKRQILDKVTGLAAFSTEGCAYYVRQLLQNPMMGRRLGRAGHTHARENFLITRHLRDYLLLFLSLNSGDEPIVYLK